VHVVADSILISDDDVLKRSNGIFSFAAIFGTGNAGDVDIEAGTLEIRGGKIAADAFSPGRLSGNITIAVDDLLIDGKGNLFPRTIETPTPGNCACLTVDTTRITTSAPWDFSGPAGNIDIVADTITVRGGAAIEAVTGGTDPGGTVTIDANSILVETDARIDTGSIGSGPGGDVILNAGDLTLASGGHITASGTGSGLAGDIFITLTDRFQSDGGFITTEALASDGGNITLNAVTMVDLLNSSITTSVEGGAGAGGNINIDPQFVIVQNSQIIANAFGGPGGNINITAGLFLIDPSSVISASSALGLDGIINVDSPVADVTSGVTELPADELDASTLVQAPCEVQTADASTLTSAGRSGLPANPNGYLPSPGFSVKSHAPLNANAAKMPVIADSSPPLQVAMAGLECT
jgi:large exoprotein involved in heme utilization and adhesion